MVYVKKKIYIRLEDRQNQMNELASNTKGQGYEADRKRGNKYMAIQEQDKWIEKQIKVQFTVNYLRKVRLILKSKLNGQKKIEGISAWSFSYLRYEGWVVTWRVEEINS